MQLFDELSDKNFELFAIRNYYNPRCVDAEEFYEDLKRFKYVKRLITRQRDNGNPPIHLLLNHLVVIFNVFGIEGGLRMLEFKVPDTEDWTIIKPFLIYLRVIENTKYSSISMDQRIVDKLRNL
tara:strand:- start:6999 stop:7370 length:372 start_codon:yes stop_codon:yes gene_type:complete